MPEKLNQDRRIAQANKEALLTLAAYALYFVWWYAFAYGLGDGDPEKYTYILGLPAWFFLSCVIGYIVLSIVLWLMIKIFFKDVPLDEEPESWAESKKEASLQELNARDAGVPGGRS